MAPGPNSSGLLLLALGKRPPEVLDGGDEFDEVLVPEEAGLVVEDRAIQRRAEVGERGRISILREQPRTEIHILLETGLARVGSMRNSGGVGKATL